MGVAAGFAHFGHFVIERLPVAGQRVAAADDDVDFLCTCRDAFADFLDAQVERGQAGGEAGGNSCDGNLSAFKRLYRRVDHVVIDADGAGRQAFHAELF